MSVWFIYIYIFYFLIKDLERLYYSADLDKVLLRMISFILEN